MDSRCHYSETWSSVIPYTASASSTLEMSHGSALKEVNVTPIVDRTDPEDVPEEDPLLMNLVMKCCCLLTIVLHLLLSLTLLKLVGVILHYT